VPFINKENLDKRS